MDCVYVIILIIAIILLLLLFHLWLWPRLKKEENNKATIPVKTENGKASIKPTDEKKSSSQKFESKAADGKKPVQNAQIKLNDEKTPTKSTQFNMDDEKTPQKNTQLELDDEKKPAESKDSAATIGIKSSVTGTQAAAQAVKDTGEKIFVKDEEADDDDGDDVAAEGKSNFHKVKVDQLSAMADQVKTRFCALDINTIGMLGNLEIVEFTAARYEDGKQKEVFSTYVKPALNAEGKLPEVAGVEDSIIRSAPEIGDALSKLLDFMGSDLLAAHNASFDARLLVNACNAQGITREFTFLDTLSIARVLFPDLPNHKLPTVAEHMGIEPDFEFRSREDTTAVAAILKKYFGF